MNKRVINADNGLYTLRTYRQRVLRPAQSNAAHILHAKTPKSFIVAFASVLCVCVCVSRASSARDDGPLLSLSRQTIFAVACAMRTNEISRARALNTNGKYAKLRLYTLNECHCIRIRIYTDEKTIFFSSQNKFEKKN